MNIQPLSSPLHHHLPLLPEPPPLGAGFFDPAWVGVTPLRIDRFHARSSAHRPRVAVKLAASTTHLHVCWHVEDAQVRSKIAEPNGPVCLDSCVELFISPPHAIGYFNLEINAGGTIHCSYIEDCAIVNDHFAQMRFVATSDLERIAVRSTLPSIIDPEIPGPLTWELAVAIPLMLFSDYVGHHVTPSGTWRANLYKCADHTSTPHWASWSPIGERLAFHQPQHFGYLHFP